MHRIRKVEYTLTGVLIFFLGGKFSTAPIQKTNALLGHYHMGI